MKKSAKRWLSALLALTLTVSALPLEAGAAWWDWLTPPSQEESDEGKELLNWLAQKAEEEEQKLNEQLGEAYERYERLKDVKFEEIKVALTVTAEGLEGEEAVTATVSDGTDTYPLTLTAENDRTVTIEVPLFRGELSYENGELQFPQVIAYSVTGSTVEGYITPEKQNFKLDFDWTAVTEGWKPAASASLTYTKEQQEIPPSDGSESGNQGENAPSADNNKQPEAEVIINTTSFTATIQWVDENVPAWLRPPVTVQLKADGEPVGEPIVLSAENLWSYTWEELPLKRNEGISLLTAEEPNDKILYDLSYEAPQGYSLQRENGLLRARLAQELTVPLDAVVFWEHGENEGTLPNSITLNIGEDEIEIEDTENNRGNVWYFDTVKELPLLDGLQLADYSKAVDVEAIDDYKSTVLTFPFYSAGAEDAAKLKDWLLSLSPSQLAELPTLENLPQTYAEDKELRWLTVVWNSYEAPQTEPDEPQTPVTVTVPVDVLTIWNDRGVETLRPASITYKLVGKDDAENVQYTVTKEVNDGYVAYEQEVLIVTDTMERIEELTFMATFEGMNRYDQEVLLLKIPSSGVDVSALAMMSVSQLKDWAAQQDAEQSGGFKLLAVVVNSRQAYGSLTVSKDVRDMDDYNIADNTKFTYKISLIYPNLSSETKTVEISENQPLVLNNLPVGTHYSVLEEGRYGYISEDIDCLQSGVIKEGSNSLTFVNRKFNLIVRMDWVNTSSWRQDDVRVYVDDNRYVLGTDNLWTDMDYAYGISDLRYRDLAVRGLPEGYEEDYSIRWKNHVAIVTVSAEYDYDYEVEDDWKDKAEDDEYRVLAKVVWVGGDAEKRPTVSAQLYRDGKAYRDAATLKSSKNSLRDWRYVWEDVSGDEDNDWNVKVTKVPAGYSCEVTKVKDNYFIITCRWSDKKENVYTGA